MRVNCPCLEITTRERLNMGKRYYCDYCDKSFADNASNRRNHLTGVFHQKKKKEHYDSFVERDPATVLAEAARLPMCNNFKTTGSCRFGNTCRWSHVTMERRAELEQQIKLRREAAERLQQAGDESPSLDDWLEKRREKKAKTDGDDEVDEKPEKSKSNSGDFQLPVYTIPPSLSSYPSLPPSLLPLPSDSYKFLPLQEWG